MTDDRQTEALDELKSKVEDAERYREQLWDLHHQGERIALDLQIAQMKLLIVQFERLP